MVNKNNKEVGAQGKMEGFYKWFPLQSWLKSFGPAVIWRFHSVPSNQEAHGGTRPFTGKDLRSHLGIQLESSDTEGPPITS